MNPKTVKTPSPAWYKLRRYVHFDLPLSVAEATELVCNPSAVATHSSWPLIGFSQRERRRKKGEGGWKCKRRPIAYASHADSHIFSYYSRLLAEPYKELIHSLGIQDAVLAYRKHATSKANYHFACDAFAEIASRSECEVLAIDIEKFFDTIPHSALKAAWKRLLPLPSEATSQDSGLPRDHYAVFRAATQFSVVSALALRRLLGLGRRAFRKQRRVELTTNDFRRRVREAGLINTNKSGIGIPQGLPISGQLANLVMIDVDERMVCAANHAGAVYRRYSDDILIIAPPGGAKSLEEHLRGELNKLGLRINDKKTVRCRFARNADGGLAADTPLQYLGLEFDGQRALIRVQTLTRFSKRMARAIKRTSRAAKKSSTSIGNVRIRRRNLLERFSHLPARSPGPNPDAPQFTFFGYTRNVNKVLDRDEIRAMFSNDVAQQMRGQWKSLLRRINKAETEINRVVPRA